MGNKRLQITLTKETVEMLESYSQKYGISKSKLIEIIVKKYIRKEFGSAIGISEK